MEYLKKQSKDMFEAFGFRLHSKTDLTDFAAYLFLIFLTGCMVGWIYEEIFYWVTEGLLRNRGILYGPWLPIYGIGALGIYMMKPLKKHPALLFILCAAVTGIVEYIIGYVGIRFFGMRLWDYRELFMNLDGIICFRSIASFAVMGVAFHYVLEPAAEHIYKKMHCQLHSHVLFFFTAALCLRLRAQRHVQNADHVLTFGNEFVYDEICL